MNHWLLVWNDIWFYLKWVPRLVILFYCLNLAYCQLSCARAAFAEFLWRAIHV